jgi:hypothetical protein
MSAGIDMGTHKIENVGNATIDNLTTSTPAAGVTKFNNGIVVSGPATFTGPASINSTLDVQDTAGNPQVMNVSGLVNFNGGDLMVGGDLKATGNLAVNSQQPLNIATLGDDTTNMQVKPIPGNSLTVATKNVVSASGNPLTTLNMRGATSRLAITDQLNTQNAPLKNYGSKLEVYTAQLNTPTTGITKVYNGAGNVTWNIQSLVQAGNTSVQGVKADHIVVDSCFGNACPPPDDNGGGL